MFQFSVQTSETSRFDELSAAIKSWDEKISATSHSRYGFGYIKTIEYNCYDPSLFKVIQLNIKSDEQLKIVENTAVFNEGCEPLVRSEKVLSIYRWNFISIELCEKVMAVLSKTNLQHVAKIQNYGDRVCLQVDDNKSRELVHNALSEANLTMFKHWMDAEKATSFL